MIRKLSLTALALTAALGAGRSTFGVDPSRTVPGSTAVPQTIDPYVNPYLPGVSTQLYPGSTSIGTMPLGTTNDPRVRYLDPLSTIPGSSAITTTNPATGDFSAAVSGASGINPSYVAPGTVTSQQPSKWRLGVYSKDTDAGVRILQVINGSAAHRAGLEANDTIVCVAGYQVGYVNGVPYDCAHEFERNADTNGWVTLLVQNNRNSKLMPLPLQLESRYSRIDGNITYQGNYQLPRDAVATVELREILRPGAPAVTIARKQVSNINTVPFAYALDYDPSLIDPRRTYILNGTITSGNRTLFDTRQQVPVINNGGGTRNVALVVQSTSYSQPGTPYVNRDDQIAQITAWFRQYLYRDPRPLELAAWTSHLDRGGSLADAQVQILSMPEYYNRADANDVNYIRQLHQQILGKDPTQEELSYWLQRMNANNRMRPEVAREFLAAVGTPR
ncbi:MAG: YbaY family lipoprotein [Planctomycetaceae bacterium]